MKTLCYKQKLIICKWPRRKKEQTFDPNMIINHLWGSDFRKAQCHLRIFQKRYCMLEMGKWCKKKKKQETFNWNSLHDSHLCSSQMQWSWESREQCSLWWLVEWQGSHLRGLWESVSCGPAKKMLRGFVRDVYIEGELKEERFWKSSIDIKSDFKNH